MEKFDVYEEITAAIISELEKGKIPWEKPWGAPNVTAVRHTRNKKTDGKPYSFLNQMLLGGKPGEYVTFKEAQAEGGKIKKGAKSKMVVYWATIYVTEKKDGKTVMKDGAPVKKPVPVLKYYRVFHIDDTEGLEVRYPVLPMAEYTHDPDEKAESVIADYAKREHLTIKRDAVSDSAFYSPGEDYVSVPKMGQFKRSAEFYSTLFHELTHSTGHESRLNRIKTTRFGSGEYSREELVAEIGAAQSLGRLGIGTESSFRNTTAYIQSWLRALKDDKRLIVSAAGKAEKAVKMIFGDEPEGSEGE